VGHRHNFASKEVVTNSVPSDIQYKLDSVNYNNWLGE